MLAISLDQHASSKQIFPNCLQCKYSENLYRVILHGLGLFSLVNPEANIKKAEIKLFIQTIFLMF